MSEKDVPNKNSDENIFGNMIIESDINSINAPQNQENVQNVNPQFINTNSINTKTLPSTTKTKSKNKNISKIKGDASNAIRCKFKNSLSLKNSLKAQKNKNKSEIEDCKKLSINKKNSQSNISFNEGTKEKIKKIKSEFNLSVINEIIDKQNEEEMNIEKDNNNNENDEQGI